MTFLYILIRKIKTVGERGSGWVLDCEQRGTPRTRVHMWERMMALSLVVCIQEHEHNRDKPKNQRIILIRESG
jgi:hypothetical protein